MFDRNALGYGTPGVKNTVHCDPSCRGCWIPSRIRAIRMALVGQAPSQVLQPVHFSSWITTTSPACTFIITSSFEECPPAPIWASATLLTGHDVQQFPQPVQSTGSMTTRNEKTRDVPSRSIVSRILPLFNTPCGQASTQSPQRIQCPLWILGIQPFPTCTTSIAPGAGHAIMQKRACWQILPVGSGNPRK